MVDIFIGLMIVRIYEYFIGEFEYPTLSFISYLAGIIFMVLFNRKHCWALSDFGILGVINSTWWEVIMPALIWVGSFLFAPSEEWEQSLILILFASIST